MTEKKFDTKKLDKLNNPKRLLDIPPDFIWDRLEMNTPELVVEIGAGTAFFCIAFQRLFQGAKIYACDLSEVMLDWVKENVSDFYPNIIPQKTKESEIPLENDLADLVYMINLHHELDNPHAILQESFRLLKPGGKLFIVDWKKQEMPEGPPEHIRCTAEEVSSQITSAGYYNVKVFEELSKHFLIIGEKR